MIFYTTQYLKVITQNILRILKNFLSEGQYFMLHSYGS